MAYISPNLKTKKALKEAVKAGKRVTVFQPGGIFPLRDAKFHSVEGPHGFHRWYARVEVNEQNEVVRVVS